MKLSTEDKDLLISLVVSKIRELNSKFLTSELDEKDKYVLINQSIPAHRRVLKSLADTLTPTKKKKLYYAFNLDCV